MARRYIRDSRGRFASGGGTVRKNRAASESTARNAVRPSPRRLGREERIAADVMGSSKFRSDTQRRAEMVRRGVKPDTDFVKLVGSARSKLGISPTQTFKDVAKARKAAKKGR